MALTYSHTSAVVASSFGSAWAMCAMTASGSNGAGLWLRFDLRSSPVGNPTVLRRGEIRSSREPRRSPAPLTVSDVARVEMAGGRRPKMEGRKERAPPAPEPELDGWWPGRSRECSRSDMLERVLYEWDKGC
jgi:hypothetical protein